MLNLEPETYHNGASNVKSSPNKILPCSLTEGQKHEWENMKNIFYAMIEKGFSM